MCNLQQYRYQNKNIFSKNQLRRLLYKKYRYTTIRIGQNSCLRYVISNRYCCSNIVFGYGISTTTSIYNKIPAGKLSKATASKFAKSANASFGCCCCWSVTGSCCCCCCCCCCGWEGKANCSGLLCAKGRDTDMLEAPGCWL